MHIKKNEYTSSFSSIFVGERTVKVPKNDAPTSLWTLDNKTHTATVSEFVGNSLCSHTEDCLNEISIYFGYRPGKSGVFKVIDSTSTMDVGKTVCLNIFHEDGTQWISAGSDNEKLYLKILNGRQIKVAFSGIAMQNVSPFDKRILFCSGLIQEQNSFSKGFQNTILRKLFSMRGKGLMPS